MGVADGQLIPVTAFESSRLAEKNVFSVAMEQEDLELSALPEIRIG